MEFRKLLFVYTIAIVAIFSLMSGVSYAWYAYSNAESTVIGSTIKEKPTIIFAQTEYISIDSIVPIEDNDRYNYASKNSFTITLNENIKDYEKGIEISLDNVLISSDLKNGNFKYELKQDERVIKTGSFIELGDTNKLVLMPMTLLDPSVYPQVYNYELYVWLSDDGSNQNHLMNKKFSAKINVNSALKRK